MNRKLLVGLLILSPLSIAWWPFLDADDVDEFHLVYTGWYPATVCRIHGLSGNDWNLNTSPVKGFLYNSSGLNRGIVCPIVQDAISSPGINTVKMMMTYDPTQDYKQCTFYSRAFDNSQGVAASGLQTVSGGYITHSWANISVPAPQTMAILCWLPPGEYVAGYTVNEGV